MRRLLLLTLLLPVSAPATEPIKWLKQARQNLEAELCKDHNPCTALENVTEHVLEDSSILRAFTLQIAHCPDAALSNQYPLRLLQRDKDRCRALLYAREVSGEAEAISPDDFARLTMRTGHKVVAQLEPDFALHARFSYSMPTHWQKEGIARGEVGNLTFTFVPPVPHVAARVTALDDAPLQQVRIVGCRLGDNTPCDSESILLVPKKQNTFTLRLSREKKGKNVGPAFKLVLLDKTSGRILAQLALPFKPAPNYAILGIAGFLVGALMAVMVSLWRREQKAVATSSNSPA